MPNNCINELIFKADRFRQADIVAALCGSDGKVDFQILVPRAMNVWWGNVGQKHEQAFKRTGLDWCTENWGTKWNAYGHRPIETSGDKIIFRFETAWRPPYPWLAAVFNTLKLSFEHNWLSEGGGLGVHGTFAWPAEGGDYPWHEAWKEQEAKDEDDPLHRRLHELLWGAEEHDEEVDRLGSAT